MPALFGYLLAVALLLGGGYGALGWLAAPEPVKLAAHAKPRAHYRVASETVTPEPSSPAINDHDQAAATSNNPPPSSVTTTGLAASERGAQAEVPASATDQQPRSASAQVRADEPEHHADTSPVEAKQAEAKQVKQVDKQPPQAALQSSSGSAQSPSSAVPSATAKSVTHPHARQAGYRSEKRELALMTLRTIEYPDGRRITRLIPYRGEERFLAFQPDE
jgi:hypothetical protein